MLAFHGVCCPTAADGKSKTAWKYSGFGFLAGDFTGPAVPYRRRVSMSLRRFQSVPRTSAASREKLRPHFER